MFIRELEERMKIIGSNTRTRIFSASYNPRYYYPYRLAKCDKAWQGIRDSCYELMMDSSFNSADIENTDVVEKSIKWNADYVFPKDYPGDAERTRDSLREFLDLSSNHDDLTSRVIPVIQPPHLDHYRAHQEFYDQFSHLAIGGLLKYDPAETVTIIKQLREAIGQHTYLHGFGVGTSYPLIKALREFAPLLDSVDVSTAERAIRSGKLPDGKLDQRPFATPYGDDSTTVRAQFSSAVLTSLNYLLSDKVNERQLKKAYFEKTELRTVQELIDETELRSRHELEYPTMDPMETPTQATTLNSFH